MRHSLGPLLRRATVGVLALTSLRATGGALAAPAPPVAEAERLAFAQRYRATQHGGIVRAANSAVSCRTTPGSTGRTAPACAAVREGRSAVNGDFDMFYVDVDRDPNTYNSSRAEVRLPEGSRVTYARLYWGGNLRVGEQKPPKDNGRVLIAEPGGAYKAVLADTVTGHRVARGADAFQASADVTGLVRESGAGLYTVAQVNVAMGRSAAGAWGGWTLVVAYENPKEPLRHLAVWDGFEALGSGAGQAIRLRGVPVPRGAGGRAGLVAYDGDRGRSGDSITLSTGSRGVSALSDPVNPSDDVLNSTISEPGAAPAARVPAYANTLGYDSDVFDLRAGLRRGGDQLAFRLVSQRDAAWAGVLFVAVDSRKQ
ncbi:DUF3344 domain-containing protein [Streptomyces galilaeus]|uniref:DUF3344 domain-containing protein n=1 Tax=Streptomyces bobili TaxID=67280 RepID=A0ABZ1R2V8_9ACTN|nr:MULTISPECIES: DUF3344 domain-containing protein [Streptomyces]QEU66065.1 DUF3344 domain-containing protein [Streptomyces galilaeus]GGW33573.1 hypothetical protein GCM10010350_16230 [Streptomyces galilaeus]